MCTINVTLKITADKTFLDAVQMGYTEDEWCKTLPSVLLSLPALVFHNSLWYISDHLVIPCTGKLQETLFTLAHDILSHYGFDKTYGSLRNAYY